MLHTPIMFSVFIPPVWPITWPCCFHAYENYKHETNIINNISETIEIERTMIRVLCLCPRDSHSCRKPIMWRRCVFLYIYMFALCSVRFSPHLNLNDLASCYSFGQFTVFTHWWKEPQHLLQSPMFATSDTLPGNSGIENTIIAHLRHKYTGLID